MCQDDDDRRLQEDHEEDEEDEEDEERDEHDMEIDEKHRHGWAAWLLEGCVSYFLAVRLHKPSCRARSPKAQDTACPKPVRRQFLEDCDWADHMEERHSLRDVGGGGGSFGPGPSGCHRRRGRPGFCDRRHSCCVCVTSLLVLLQSR